MSNRSILELDIGDTLCSLSELLFTTQEDRFLQLQSVAHIHVVYILFLFCKVIKKDIFKQSATLLQGTEHS